MTVTNGRVGCGWRWAEEECGGWEVEAGRWGMEGEAGRGRLGGRGYTSDRSRRLAGVWDRFDPKALL